MPSDKKGPKASDDARVKKETDNKERGLVNTAFYSDNLLAFLYKKTERLSIALYMMTSFIGEEEPIRKDLREKGLALLRNISGLDGSFGDISLSGKKALRNLFEVASGLDIAASSGMISQMNYSIVKDVIVELTELIEGNFNIKGTKSSLINPDFFYVKDIFLNEADKGQETIKDIYKGQYYKRHNVLYNSEKESLNSKGGDISRNKGFQSSSTANTANLTPKAKNRRETILNMLENKDKINATEVCEVITDCSEKTIQRDLLKMVDEGVLVKEGERRWSTYKLAK